MLLWDAATHCIPLEILQKSTQSVQSTTSIVKMTEVLIHQSSRRVSTFNSSMFQCTGQMELCWWRTWTSPLNGVKGSWWPVATAVASRASFESFGSCGHWWRGQSPCHRIRRSTSWPKWTLSLVVHCETWWYTHNPTQKCWLREEQMKMFEPACAGPMSHLQWFMMAERSWSSTIRAMWSDLAWMMWGIGKKTCHLARSKDWHLPGCFTIDPASWSWMNAPMVFHQMWNMIFMIDVLAWTWLFSPYHTRLNSNSSTRESCTTMATSKAHGRWENVHRPGTRSQGHLPQWSSLSLTSQARRNPE